MLVEKTRQELFDSIKDYVDLCREAKVEPLEERNFSFLGPGARKALAFNQLQDIANFLNGDWKANFSDGKQRKWYPYFELKQGHGLVFGGSSATTATTLGRLLCSKTRKLLILLVRLFPIFISC